MDFIASKLLFSVNNRNYALNNCLFAVRLPIVFSILKVLKCRFWGRFLIKYSTNWRVGVNLLSSSKHSKHGTLPQVGNPKPRSLTQLMHIAQLRLKFVVYLCLQWYHNASSK